MGEQPGADEQGPESPQETGGRPGTSVFRENFARISGVLRVLDNADDTPDILDRESGTEKGVTEAEHLYMLAKSCRATVRAAKADGLLTRWAARTETMFEESFQELIDAWTAYKAILPLIGKAGWGGGGPTPGQIQSDLKVPRRAFITALNAYNAQLQAVQQYLPDEGVTPAS